MMMWKTAFRFVVRDLRSGLGGFRMLVVCLALGVAVLAASLSLRAAVDATLVQDARALLGGDMTFSRTYFPLSEAERQTLERFGTVSEGLSMRTMARGGEGRKRVLAELKTLDAAYPLVGQAELEPPQSLAEALEQRDGVWGAVVETPILEHLGLKIGDTLTVGNGEFAIRAVVKRLPDRVTAGLTFGAQVLVRPEAATATGLLTPTSMARYTARLLLEPEQDLTAIKTAVEAAHPDAGWETRDRTRATPGLRKMLNDLSTFLTLVGLTALLVGGIGIANASRAALERRLGAIAILKSIGAPPQVIVRTYGLLLAVMTGLGLLIGLAVGAVVPSVVVALAGEAMPLRVSPSLYVAPLAAAAAFGALTAVIFGAGPLLSAVRIPATVLWRRHGQAVRWPALLWWITGIGACGLLGLVLLIIPQKGLALAFAAGCVAAVGLFHLVAVGIVRMARVLAHRSSLRHSPLARLTLGSMSRSGSGLAAVVLSLGLGLTVLVGLVQIEGNMNRQLAENLPLQAPSLYFIDLPMTQEPLFRQTVQAAVAEAQVQAAPMMRGRIVDVKGVAADLAPVTEDMAWVLRGDRGLTTAATVPPHNTVLKGDWWPADYQGPPLVSLSDDVAEGLGLSIGDRLVLNILGREMAVTVANIRKVAWLSLEMNFALVLSPNTLDGLPLSMLATVHTPLSMETAVEQAVSDALPGVTVIRVGEVLREVRRILSHVEVAVQGVALVVLLVGGLVLAAAVQAGQRQRLREAAVFSALGATRADLWRVWLGEFATLGLVVGVAATLMGSLAAWLVLSGPLRLGWEPLPVPTLVTIGASLLVTLCAGSPALFGMGQRRLIRLLRED